MNSAHDFNTEERTFEYSAKASFNGLYITEYVAVFGNTGGINSNTYSTLFATALYSLCFSISELSKASEIKSDIVAI